ncbi:isoleucine--tRNA ligase [Marinivivus vitaminiproducens]|uniref:isoleucine--tRNA ligase n=1 Tax=Marinivivus vitaminiproducens TaxID=3035935 RepID=UPI00279B41AF|nr:isoleucine--tRNA ligase [Geminicoccaceae bacterium SCSIO 64248]
MTTDYRATVFLPATAFPMKANLPNREPEMLAFWRESDLWQTLRAQSEGREKFVLHDGPPYANGHIHMGTALNKILKDVINRSQQMLGKDAVYVPGWDCHGLPIEWQIEQAYRKKGRSKDEVPVVELRRECREFAANWIDVQREEFKRLGVQGDWDHPYTTMAFAAEAGIFRELAKFLMNGSLYRGKKSVMWSVVEKTALAEAEVEYHDHTSTTIFVRFAVVESPNPALAGASVVIWTTTPWTMPANRAVAYGEDLDYRVIEVEEAAEGSLAVPGERLVLAADLVEAVAKEAGIERFAVRAELSGTDLAGTTVRHPLALADAGYALTVPLLPAGFVTVEQGTGLVHIAPAHGADDFDLGAEHGLEVPDLVQEDGTYAGFVPLFAGQHVFKVAEAVKEALVRAGSLLASGTLVHSYPHSWRSKAPLIFRATPQWFIALDDGNAIRAKALEAIGETRWVPGAGENRIRGMIEHRPDWCVSRQRAWGVPIAVFVEKATGEVLRDPAVNARIEDAFAAEGADAWFASGPERFLGDAYAARDYEQVTDILDVWFDSGSTHATVLEQRPELCWPATLYLEGSDQHRGWFHSSLLEACGTRGRAPYEQVLTHGFVVDGQGRKMSKSLGNTVSPQDVMKTMGADILRLWVVSGDYSEDVRISDEIMAGQADAYRRMRNTFRYLLGNLADFREDERLPVERMPELERWVLHRLSELGRLVVEANAAYDFQRLYSALHTFCAVDLSAFYFDIRKDALYCDPTGSVRRRAARTVLDRVFDCLTAWLAPVLVFTAEEAWRSRFPDRGSVHLRAFPAVPPEWSSPALAAKWQRVRRVRRVVTGALEVERREKRIGASLQAAPIVHVTAEDAAALEGLDLAELAITSGVTVVKDAIPEGAFTLEDTPGVGVVPALADGHKCARCWQVLPEVGTGDAPDLCLRCDNAVASLEAA